MVKDNDKERNKSQRDQEKSNIENDEKGQIMTGAGQNYLNH